MELTTEMIMGLSAFGIFLLMWVILPSRLHRKDESKEE